MTLRMKIVWDVLNAAKDCNDTFVINACRNLINANRIGKWSMADWSIVKEFA